MEKVCDSFASSPQVKSSGRKIPIPTVYGSKSFELSNVGLKENLPLSGRNGSNSAGVYSESDSFLELCQGANPMKKAVFATSILEPSGSTAATIREIHDMVESLDSAVSLIQLKTTTKSGEKCFRKFKLKTLDEFAEAIRAEAIPKIERAPKKYPRSDKPRTPSKVMHHQATNTSARKPPAVKRSVTPKSTLRKWISVEDIFVEGID